MVWTMFANASIVGKLGVMVALLPMAAAVVYVVKPSERTLALIRPLSLAAIFAGITTLTSGLANVLMAIGYTGEFNAGSWRNLALGSAESLIGLFVACGSLTITWLLVALGMRRAV